VEQGDLLCLLIQLVAALLKKVFVSVFDLIDAAFERRGTTLTSAPSRGGLFCHISRILQYQRHPSFSCAAHTRRKTEINDSINDSFLSRLGLKLPTNDSNNVFGFESFPMSCLCHLSRLLTRG
jgi:hypothetical protein